MRRIAIVLAVGVAGLDLGTYVWNEVRLASSTGSVLELGIGAFVSRLLMMLTVLVPWLVGAALLARRRRALGAAVLVPVAILTVPGVLFLGQWTSDLISFGGNPTVWAELATATLMWVAAVLAGVAAWRARPGAGTRVDAPGVGNVYVVFAFLAWLPTVLVSTQFVPPGPVGTSETARNFYEFIWENSGGLGAAVGISEALLFGALLLLGPMVRRDAAGAVVLVLALPALIQEVQTILEVAPETYVVSAPASYLGVLGLLGVSVTGVIWLRQGAPRAVEAAQATSEPWPRDSDDAPSSGGAR